MLSANIPQVLPAWQALCQEPELPRKPDSQVPVGHRDRGTNTSLTPTRHAEQQHLTQPKCYLGGFLEEVSGGSAAQAPWPVLTAWLSGLLRSCSQPLQAGAAQISDDSLGLPAASG